MGLKKYGSVLLLLMIIMISSCKSMRIAKDEPARPMPATYAGGADSANGALVNWRRFFDDRHLADLVDTALAHNWDMRIALQRINIYRADVLLNRGAMKPYVRGIAGAGVNRYGLYTMDGAGNSTTPIYDGRIVPEDLQTYQVGIQASWEADVWGKLRNRKKAALNRLLASMEGRSVVITNLVSDVAGEYYELMALDNQMDIINETIKLQEDALEIVKVQKQAAMATELGVEQFEAQLLSLKAMRAETTQRITEAESRINMLLGRYPQTIERDKKVMSLPLPARVRTGVPYALLQNRPDIRQAEAELAATKADVKAARAAFYPSLNITGGVGLSAFLPKLLFTTPQSLAYNLFAGLTGPLFNRSAIQAEFDRSNALQQEALANYQRSVTRGYTEVYVQLNKITNLQQVYDLKTAQVATLTRSINTSSELFKTGRSSYLEVLIAQQNTLRARLELVDSKKDMFRSTVNIYRSLGGGWR